MTPDPVHGDQLDRPYGDQERAYLTIQPEAPPWRATRHETSKRTSRLPSTREADPTQSP
jgi:hypothetical protein